MGNKSFSSKHNSGARRSGDDCQICLGAANSQGGVAILSPGCCGKFYHQSCLYSSIQSGNVSCPNCRSPFSADLLKAAGASALPVQMPAQPTLGKKKKQYSLRSRLSAMNISGDVSVETEDELVSVDGRTDEKATKKNAAIVVPPHIRISAIPERNEVTMTAFDNFHVNVNLKVSEMEATADAVDRMPMDVVCVLDNSGSMEGSKIESLRVAMKYVRSQLKASDRLSIVSFNSSSQLVHALLRMDEHKKQQSDNLCDLIHAGGGTSIYAGLRQAMEILDSRKTRNPLSCVFLLTDGQDNSNMTEKKALGADMRSKGYTLNVFGFGADHDATQLQMIANAAEGSFCYVEADDLVTDAFGGAIGGTQGTVAKDMSVTIRVPTTSSASSSPGIRITTANAGRYSCTAQPDGSYVVTFANLFAGEQRDIMVVLSVPAGSTGSSPILLASGTYFTVTGTTMSTVPDVSHSACEVSTSNPAEVQCIIHRSASPSASTNTEVDVQVNRFKALSAMQLAMSSADRGEYQGANAVLTKCIKEIKASPAYASNSAVVLSSVADLEEAVTNTSDRYNYTNSGGKATMCENLSTQEMQRTLYCKASKAHNPYQSMFSMSSQSEALTFKSKY